MLSVPYVNLAAQAKTIQPELIEAVERVLESGNYILGDEVSAFESAFAEYCGTRYAVGVANGTDAIVLALKALKIGAGDEIRIGRTALKLIDFQRATKESKGKEEGSLEVPPIANLEKILGNEDPHTLTSTNIINRWPDNIFSLPKDAQKQFIHYVDEKGTQGQILLGELLKTTKNK